MNKWSRQIKVFSLAAILSLAPEAMQGQSARQMTENENIALLESKILHLPLVQLQSRVTLQHRQEDVSEYHYPTDTILLNAAVQARSEDVVGEMAHEYIHALYDPIGTKGLAFDAKYGGPSLDEAQQYFTRQPDIVDFVQQYELLTKQAQHYKDLYTDNIFKVLELKIDLDGTFGPTTFSLDLQQAPVEVKLAYDKFEELMLSEQNILDESSEGFADKRGYELLSHLNTVASMYQQKNSLFTEQVLPQISTILEYKATQYDSLAQQRLENNQVVQAMHDGNKAQQMRDFSLLSHTPPGIEEYVNRRYKNPEEVLAEVVEQYYNRKLPMKLHNKAEAFLSEFTYDNKSLIVE